MNQFVALGLYFGYPLCCIKERNDGRMKMFRAEPIAEDFWEERKLIGTGYVPCKACNDAYSEEELIAHIAAARIAPTPFPDHDEDAADQWLDKVEMT